jgi:Uma2 family endonuclease
MAIANQQQRMTEAEYLAFDRESETKHEFIDGQVYAMSGASPNHNWIAGSTYASLYSQMRGRPCKVGPSDLKIHMPATGSFVYPDISIVCDEPEYGGEQSDMLLNPVVVIEVLSPSTEHHDRNVKFHHYWTIPTLKAVVFIAQDEARVERYNREGSNAWQMTIARGLDASMELPSIGCTLPLAEVYEEVTFEREQTHANDYNQ